MPEPEDVTGSLRRHGDWLDRSLVTVDPAELRRRADGAGAPTTSTDDGPVPLTTGDPPRRSRLPFLAVAAALLAVVGVVGALLIAARGDERGEQVELLLQPTSESWTAVPEQTFPDPAMIVDAQVVWTGTEVVVLGGLSATGVPEDVQGKGVTALGASYAYDPAAGSWRTISAPPVELPGSDVEVAWTGSELVVVGPAPYWSGPTTAARGAAYDPATDIWRPIAEAPPGRGIGGTAAWDGSRMLFWALSVGVTAYDPATDTWTPITTEPIGTPGSPSFNSATASAVWTGTELVVADGGSPGIAAFDPATATWRTLPDRPEVSIGAQPIVWTGRVIGSGDRRGPAWMEPGEAAWHQPSGPTPEHAGSVPAAQVWVGDRFISWAGAVYGGPSSPRAPASDEAIALDLTTGTWSDAPAPPAVDPPYGDAVLAGDRIFTFSIDNDFQHVAGHGTIRAALSSPGFGVGTLGPPITPPTTDPASADFCAAMLGYLETYQREVAVARPSSDDIARAQELQNQADAVGHEIAATEAQIEADPDHAEAHRQKAIALRDRQMELELEADDIKVGSRVELAERAVADFERLTQQSPPEVRGAMELLLAQGQRMLAEGPSQPVRPTAEEAEANNAIDDWLKAHCGFTMSNPNPVASSPGSTPDTAPAGTMVVGAPGP